MFQIVINVICTYNSDYLDLGNLENSVSASEKLNVLTTCL